MTIAGQSAVLPDFWDEFRQEELDELWAEIQTASAHADGDAEACSSGQCCEIRHPSWPGNALPNSSPIYPEPTAIAEAGIDSIDF